MRGALFALLPAALALPTLARADFITPIEPPTCPTYASYPFKYGTMEMDEDWQCQTTEHNPNNPCPHYANNINHWRIVSANAWTSQIDLHVTSFAVGLDGYDALNTQYNSWVGTISNPFWMQVGGGPSSSNYLAFQTNDTGTAGEFAIDQIRLCTNMSAPNAVMQNLTDNLPMIGALQGPGDGIIYSFFLDSGQHAGIAMIAQGSNNFDLYAECDGLPFDHSRWTSTLTGPHDFLHIDGCQGSGHSVYVTVRSTSGAGAYTLVMAKHMANKDLRLKAATNFVPSEAVKTSAMNVLAQGSKRIYGASEGRMFITGWDFYPGPSCDVCPGTCDFCFKDICDSCGRGSTFQNGQPFAEILGCSVPNGCTGPNSFTVGLGYLNGFIDEANTDYGASRVTAHELGHKVGGFPDEYINNTGGVQCAHTIMWDPLWHPRLKNYCTYSNHNKNGNVTPLFPKSNQQILNDNGMGPDWLNFAGTGTPDDYDYADFNFNGKIGVVTIPSAVKVPAGNDYTRVVLALSFCAVGVLLARRRKVS
jgi:hypothetical protein